jgi:hypothetical protein
MSDSKQPATDSSEPVVNGDQTERTEYVERSDVGVSLSVKLKRGSGTRDEDQIKAKVKAKTLEDARRDMDALREYIHDLAEDIRQIQPTDPHE